MPTTAETAKPEALIASHTIEKTIKGHEIVLTVYPVRSDVATYVATCGCNAETWEAYYASTMEAIISQHCSTPPAFPVSCA